MTDFLFHVQWAQREILANPWLWNQIHARTRFEGSPHREVDDIWLRYNSPDSFDAKAPKDFHGPHEDVWYPACEYLPETIGLIEDLVQRVGAANVGGCLLTRVPAGKQVYPHVDHSWHADHYEKYAIQILGNKEQAFHFETDSVSACDGECYWFNNHYLHWVTNPTKEDRITLIVSLRRPT